MSQSVYEEWIESNKKDDEWSQHGIRQWVKGLDFLLPSYEQINKFYIDKQIKKNKPRLEKDRIIELCSNLGMALNFYSNLNCLECKNIDELQTIVLICWYYGIYFSARSMCLSKDHIFKQETHMEVCDYWLNQISKHDLVPAPFNFYVDSVFNEDVDKYFKSKSNYDPNFQRFPKNEHEAETVILKHLRGSIRYREDKKKQEYRDKAKIKKIASESDKEKINKILKKTGCCFMHQTYRYRIKNNYKKFSHLQSLTYSIVDDLKKALLNILRVFAI